MCGSGRIDEHFRRDVRGPSCPAPEGAGEDRRLFRLVRCLWTEWVNTPLPGAVSCEETNSPVSRTGQKGGTT